jgi:hypothetical protein
LMSVDFKYSVRELSSNEALRNFLEDEMNRPDSLDELVSVLPQTDGSMLAVIRSKRQARTKTRSERNFQTQKNHERFQNDSNYQEPGAAPRRHRAKPQQQQQTRHDQNNKNTFAHKRPHGKTRNAKVPNKNGQSSEA